jgi:hypothetical protein
MPDLPNMKIRLPPAEAKVSVFTYRLIAVLVFLAIIVIFAFADQGYCTTTAAIAVGKDEAHSCFEYWLNRYQSLIGGMLALFGAYLAFSAVQKQIRQTEQHANDRRERESDAARAVLQMALSDLEAYAGECITSLRDLRANTPISGSPWPIPDFPDFPRGTIDALQDVVRNCDRKEADELADLIFNAQVQQSRLRSFKQDISGATYVSMIDRSIQDRALDAGDLYARITRLFDFARRSYDRYLVSADDVAGALRLFYIEVEGWPLLRVDLERRRKAEEVRAARSLTDSDLGLTSQDAD